MKKIICFICSLLILLSVPVTAYAITDPVDYSFLPYDVKQSDKTIIEGSISLLDYGYSKNSFIFTKDYDGNYYAVEVAYGMGSSDFISVLMLDNVPYFYIKQSLVRNPYIYKLVDNNWVNIAASKPILGNQYIKDNVSSICDIYPGSSYVGFVCLGAVGSCNYKFTSTLQTYFVDNPPNDYTNGDTGDGSDNSSFLFEKILQEIENIKNGQVDIKGDIADLINANNSLKTKIDNVLNYLKQLNIVTDGLESAIKSLKTPIDNVNTTLGNIKLSIDGVNTSLDNIKTSLNDLNTNIVTKFDELITHIFYIRQFVFDINQFQLPQIYDKLKSIDTRLNLFYLRFTDYFDAYITIEQIQMLFNNAIAEFLGMEVTIDFDNMNFDYSITDNLHDMLINVYHEINNYVNPLSPDNADEFNNALAGLKQDTFIGGIGTVVNTEIPKLVNCLSVNSSPVLHFTSPAIDTKLFHIPSYNFNINFSWYAPFKPYGDMILSGFIWLFYLWRFFINLPKLIRGEMMSTAYPLTAMTEEFMNDDGVILYDPYSNL